MCLYCISQVHHQHVAFWVNVRMATPYRWKQRPGHRWSPSYIIARRFGCRQPSTDCLQAFLDWVGRHRLMWKPAMLPAAPAEGSRSWDLEGHKLRRGPAALTALHKELPATVSKKMPFSKDFWSETKVSPSLQLCSLSCEHCKKAMEAELATCIALLECSPRVWHCTGTTCATGLGWSLLAIALVPIQP